MAQPANEQTIAEVKEVFRNYLKEQNHRQTPERFMVLEEIYRSDGHLDADEMYFKLINSGSRVSRATVYNTLDLLVECGLVQRQQFGKNQSLYERAYSYQQHDHIICSRCESVLEFCDPRILEIQNMLEKIHKFKIADHSLHFYGECDDPETCVRRIEAEERKRQNEQNKREY